MGLLQELTELAILYLGVRLNVRALLMAALGVAGLLLPNLPALSQLSDDTSIFNGEVAGTCSFVGLENEIALSFRSSGGVNGAQYLSGGDNFAVTTNSSIRVAASYAISKEPSGFQVGAGERREVLLGETNTGLTRASSPGAQTNALLIPGTPGTTGDTLSVSMRIDPANAPGEYQYVVTLSCLVS